MSAETTTTPVATEEVKEEVNEEVKEEVKAEPKKLSPEELDRINYLAPPWNNASNCESCNVRHYVTFTINKRWRLFFFSQYEFGIFGRRHHCRCEIVHSTASNHLLLCFFNMHFLPQKHTT